MGNFEIKIHKSFSIELKKNWEEFEKNSSHYIFQKFEWQKLWFENQLENKHKIQNCTIFVYENSNLIMILPFNIKEKFTLKILSWSGFPFSDYNCPLIKNNISKSVFDEIWKIITNQIEKDYDCIVLAQQPSKILKLENPFSKYLKTKVNNLYYGIYLNNEFELKKNELNNIKYQINRLKKLGKLEFKIMSENENLTKIVNFIISNKSEQYKRTNAWNLFKIDSNKNFFRLIHMKLKQNIFIASLSLDNEMIAAHSGFVYNNRLYYLFPAYNHIYNKYSPGKILLKKLIEISTSRRIDNFDLTIGYENYKKNYSNYTLESSVFLDFKNIRGIIYISFVKLKLLIKDLLFKQMN